MNSASGSKITRSASRPTSIAPLRSRRARRAGAAQSAHPARQPLERMAARAGSRPHHRQPKLHGRDASPRRQKVSRRGVLHCWRRWRVIRDDGVDRARVERRPEVILIRPITHWRRALDQRRRPEPPRRRTRGSADTSRRFRGANRAARAAAIGSHRIRGRQVHDVRADACRRRTAG